VPTRNGAKFYSFFLMKNNQVTPVGTIVDNLRNINLSLYIERKSQFFSQKYRSIDTKLEQISEARSILFDMPLHTVISLFNISKNGYYNLKNRAAELEEMANSNQNFPQKKGFLTENEEKEVFDKKIRLRIR